MVNDENAMQPVNLRYDQSQMQSSPAALISSSVSCTYDYQSKGDGRRTHEAEGSRHSNMFDLLPYSRKGGYTA